MSETIDITPTWSDLVLIMAQLWAENKDPQLRDELLRMASIADLYVAEQKEAQG